MALSSFDEAQHRLHRLGYTFVGKRLAWKVATLIHVGELEKMIP